MTSPITETLAAVWREVLEIDEVRSTDDFFELGGDSVLALTVIARARDRGLAVAIRDVLAYPVLGDLAARVGELAAR